MRLELWEKWVFIAAAAAITCLMRASIGDIVAAGAADLSERLLEECRAIAAANGFAPRPAAIERYRADHDRGRLADLGVDAEGHRARRAGRGRPRDRRPAAPRPRGADQDRRRCCASPTPTSRPTRRGGPPTAAELISTDRPTVGPPWEDRLDVVAVGSMTKAP
jgi:hypothetical protein